MRSKGSVTIFAALTIMLVAQVVFLLLEGARYDVTRRSMVIQSKSATESIMAQYCRPLWEEYHLLAYDLGDRQGNTDLGQIETEITYCSKESNGKSLLNSELGTTSIAKYTVLTDNKGQPYYAAVSSYMRENIVYEEAKLLYSYYKSLKDIKDGDSYKESDIDQALKALEEEKKSNKGNNAGKKGSCKYLYKSNAMSEEKNTQEEKKEENPLEDVSKKKANGILSLVLGKDGQVSTRQIHDNPVSARNLNTGLNPSTFETNWLDNVLFCQYMASYMSCYTDSKGHYMNYEMEYLLGGKAQDEDNLKLVVTELLAIRTAANLLHIITSEEKKAEALALATAIAGVSANPALIDLVKNGLIAAWAFCESVLDLRTLLQGGRVPMLKSNESWSSGIKGLSKNLDGKTKAKESKFGLNYKEYMAILLMFSNSNKLSFRGMDLQEASLRSIEGYEKIQMDNMICDLETETEYKFNSIFGGFVSLIKGPSKSFNKKVKTSYAYYKK